MIVDKPEIVYVMENQSVTITVTLNHVNAAVIWKRYLFLLLLMTLALYFYYWQVYYLTKLNKPKAMLLRFPTFASMQFFIFISECRMIICSS